MDSGAEEESTERPSARERLGDSILATLGAGSGDGVWSHGQHIYFYCPVSKDSVYKLNREMLDLQNDFAELQRGYPDVAMVPPPIYLHINSFGGSVFAGFAAVDFIQQSSLPVYTIVEGATASAATMMSVAGKRRYMRPHASMLIHELSTWFEGKMSRVEDEIDNLRQMMEDIKAVYRAHTKLDGAELEELLKHDLWPVVLFSGWDVVHRLQNPLPWFSAIS